MKKIGFIGGGNMGGALIKGVCKAVDPTEVAVFDTDKAKLASLCGECGCVAAESRQEIAQSCEYVVLAVKPQVLRGVLEAVAPVLAKNAKEGKVQKLVSIAAGITVADLEEIPAKAGVDMPVIRMLPNTPAEIGLGLIIYCANSLADRHICARIDAMFAHCGIVEKIDEHILDCASAVSGCTPAFGYMFIDALADGAVRCGVPRDKAIKYAARAVQGAAAMVLQTGRHPGRLKDAVCSPGGSTIVGVAALEDGGFRSAAANGVFLANEKNKQLGQK